MKDMRKALFRNKAIVEIVSMFDNELNNAQFSMGQRMFRVVGLSWSQAREEQSCYPYNGRTEALMT